MQKYNEGWRNLSSTINEVETLSDRFRKSQNNSKNIMLLTGNQALESTIKGFSGNSPSIIHFATHGFYFSEQESHRLNYYSGCFGETDSIPEEERIGLVLSCANDSWTGKKESGGGTMEL